MQANTVQIVRGLERRRKWSIEERAAIVSEAMGSDTTLLAVARKYDVHPRLIYRWKKELEAASQKALLPEGKKRGRPKKAKANMASPVVAPKPKIFAVEATPSQASDSVQLIVGDLVITVATGGKR